MTAVALLALPALPAAFQQSNVNYLAVLPLLIVFVTALVGVLVEAFAPRERRHVIQVTLAVVGLLAAAASIILAAKHQGLTMGLTDGSTNRPALRPGHRRPGPLHAGRDPAHGRARRPDHGRAVRRRRCRGCCTAHMTFACTGSTSAAKWLTKSSSGSQAKPCVVDDQVRQRRRRRCPAPSSAPIDSPSSSPNAAM